MKLNKCILGTVLGGFAILPLQAAIEKTPWQITTNAYVEFEEFRGYKINDSRIFDKISPTLQMSLRNPSSKWSYDLEYKLSVRSITKSLKTEDTTFNRNRFQVGINRNIYSDKYANFNLNFTYRKESNDVKAGMPAKGSYNLYWLMPSGQYKLSDNWTLTFWDAFYFYDHSFTKNSLEWESEHGIQYQVIKDRFSIRLMYYTDWTWDHNSDKNWEQNQVRGYFPTTINKQWTVLPYFRYFVSEKNYDVANNRKVTQKNDKGLRVGTVVNYHMTPKTTLWTNLAFEGSTWREPKGNGLTRGGNNRQDFFLYSFGVRHAW